MLRDERRVSWRQEVVHPVRFWLRKVPTGLTGTGTTGLEVRNTTESEELLSLTLSDQRHKGLGQRHGTCLVHEVFVRVCDCLGAAVGTDTIVERDRCTEPSLCKV